MRAEHLPMLEWMAKVTKQRVKKGRIALLENPETSRAFRIEFLEDLDGIEDGMVADALFEFVVGGQCMLGQHDRETGELFRGRTKWGTNSSRLKAVLSVKCDESHSHKLVTERNKFGPCTSQKAEWPIVMCRHLLRACVQELMDRIAHQAFPAEMALEESAEAGPLDDGDQAMRVDLPRSSGDDEGVLPRSS